MVATAQLSTDTGQTNLYGRIQTALAVEAIESEKDLLRLVENRLSIQVIGALVKHGLTDNEIYTLIIPRRTLAHRQPRYPGCRTGLCYSPQVNIRLIKIVNFLVPARCMGTRLSST